MGIDRTTYEALLNSLSNVTEKKSALTLGRQGLHLSFKDFFEISIKNAFAPTSECYQKFCEHLLLELGFEIVDSIDNSGYEGATIIADMNRPIAIDKTYDLVFDGGTLEHIFNFPQAIENVINFLKIGGIFCSVTTNNNFSGHGFYQFSPELFYRVFREKYGMKILKIYLSIEGEDKNSWKEIDPSKHDGNHRNEFHFDTTRHVYIITYAVKVSNARVNCIDVPPQQLNYEEIDWKLT